MKHATPNKSGVGFSSRVMALGLAMGVAIGAARSASAAIMLQQSSPIPLATGGLVQYTISAVGTAGDVISRFTHPTITPTPGSLGVHNVWQLFTNGQTPTKEQHTPVLFPPEFAPYDTYFLFDASQVISFGPEFSETNDGSTTISPVPNPPNIPRSGFGQYDSSTLSQKVLIPSLQSSNVPFMQVVMRAGDTAWLRVLVEGPMVGIGFPQEILLGEHAPDDPLVAIDAELGVNVPIISHQFTATGGTAPFTWSNLTLISSTPPAVAAALEPNGQFTWHSINSPRCCNLSWTWSATVTDSSNPAQTDTATLTVRFIPEPATMSLICSALVGLLGFARQRRVIERNQGFD
jgi:hypothetical protein